MRAGVIEVGSLPAGNAGAMRTAELVARSARRSARQEEAHQLAWQVVAGARDWSPAVLAHDAHHLVAQLVVFEPDPPDVELIRGPTQLLRERRGDCDDKAALLAAILAVLGLAVRLRLTRSDPREPDRFSHIYVEVFLPGRGWTPSDPTFAGNPFGVRLAPEHGPAYTVPL